MTNTQPQPPDADHDDNESHGLGPPIKPEPKKKPEVKWTRRGDSNIWESDETPPKLKTEIPTPPTKG